MLYYGDGGIILKKLDGFFKQHPFYYSFGISLGVIVLQTLVNIIQHRPMFDEIGSILYGIGIILFSLLIARLTHRVYVRFGAAFIINFAYFSIQTLMMVAMSNLHLFYCDRWRGYFNGSFDAFVDVLIRESI